MVVLPFPITHQDPNSLHISGCTHPNIWRKTALRRALLSPRALLKQQFVSTLSLLFGAGDTLGQAQAHSTAQPPQAALGPAHRLGKAFSFHPLCKHWSMYILCSCPTMFCSQLLPVGKGALPTHMRCKLCRFNPFGPRIHGNGNASSFRSKKFATAVRQI